MSNEELLKKYTTLGIHRSKIVVVASPHVTWSTTKKIEVRSRDDAFDVVEYEDGSKMLSTENNIGVTLKTNVSISETEVEKINNSEGILVYPSPNFRYAFIPTYEELQEVLRERANEAENEPTLENVFRKLKTMADEVQTLTGEIQRNKSLESTQQHDQIYVSWEDHRYPIIVIQPTSSNPSVGYSVNLKDGSLTQICICAAHSDNECCCAYSWE